MQSVTSKQFKNLDIKIKKFQTILQTCTNTKSVNFIQKKSLSKEKKKKFSQQALLHTVGSYPLRLSLHTTGNRTDRALHAPTCPSFFLPAAPSCCSTSPPVGLEPEQSGLTPTAELEQHHRLLPV